MDIRIVVDLDDVLVDFTRPAAALWGLTIDQLLPFWPRGTWAMLPALGCALGRQEPVGWDEFWDMLDGKREFWEQLPPLPWANDLLAYVQCVTPDWHIITSPGRCDSSYDGKLRLIRKLVGPSFTRFAITPHKEIAANEHTILIDDRPENIATFRKHGGHGVLFPRFNNGLHDHADRPMYHIKAGVAYWKEEMSKYAM
jgi:hypothetical protein